MTKIVLNISVPEKDLVAQLELQIEDEVRRRIAATGTTLEAIKAMDMAIETVTRAVSRVEDSRNSRDEPASLKALVSAASGLRFARRNYQKGL